MNDQKAISYEMRLVNTEAVTGYFDCVPLESMKLEDAIDTLCTRPMDTFLHRHVLNMLCSMPLDDIMKFISSRDSWARPSASLFKEAAIINPLLRLPESIFAIDDDLTDSSPLINLRSPLASQKSLSDIIIPLLKDNILEYAPLRRCDDESLSMLRSSIGSGSPVFSSAAFLKKAYQESFEVEHDYPRRLISPAGAAKLAADRLDKIGIFASEEMRHVSSLSPIALLRKWNLKTVVKSGRNVYGLSGIHTAYGKGLYLDDARASCVMEILERYCSYASVENDTITGTKSDYPLICAKYSEISKCKNALFPGDVCLEVDYHDEPLWWISATQITSGGVRQIHIPAQMVYLFSNFDEPDLFSGLGSTGLASHTDMASAKKAAILECIERDSDTVSVFDRSKCFRIMTRDPEIAPLFSAYEERGINMQFQDISNETGIPCFRCLVNEKSGKIVKGTSADLNSKKAILSAIMETPFPFPYGQPSGPFIQDDLPVIYLEDLPDYSTDNSYQDLYILEKTLLGTGFSPIYVDLTRNDVDFPVVRAIIPGLEIMNDFDSYSRLSRRMAFYYLNGIGCSGI